MKKKILLICLLLLVLLGATLAASAAPPPTYWMEPDTAVTIVCSGQNLRYKPPSQGQMNVYCGLPVPGLSKAK